MINTRFWDDAYTANLDPVEKLLFLYFLTNPGTDICGIYELPLKNVATDTGIDRDMVEKILKRFTKDKKVYYVNGWVAVSNFIFHQTINPSVGKGIENGLNKAPVEIIKKLGTAWVQRVVSVLQTLGNLNLNSNFNLNPKLSEESPPINNFTAEDMRMVDLLVLLIKAKNPDWQMKGKIESWAEDINKIHRIDERTYEQIEYMIRWTQNDSFWCQNILSASKLREKFNDLIPRVRGKIQMINDKKPKVIFS